VVKQYAETQTIAGRGPLKHLQVAVGIAEGGDGPPADVLVDGDGLARLIVNEVDFGQAH
jgi:hypothetical protein